MVALPKWSSKQLLRHLTEGEKLLGVHAFCAGKTLEARNNQRTDEARNMANWARQALNNWDIVSGRIRSPNQ